VWGKLVSFPVNKNLLFGRGESYSLIDRCPGASFTKPSFVSEVSFGSFLLANTHNFFGIKNNFYL
jgi:hypothetical protein